MSTLHTVKQGEYLSSIAKSYGLANSRLIWDHPENAKLKQKRKNPNILFPGDTLFIPDGETLQDPFMTGQRYHFRLTTLKLRLKVSDVSGQPLKNTPCKVEVEGDTTDLTTDGNGLVERNIPPSAENGVLTIQEIEIKATLKIGHLDPIEERTGQIERLNNLGYGAARLSGLDEAQFKLAIEEFQCNHQLQIDGICGSQTQAKLVEIHGC